MSTVKCFNTGRGALHVIWQLSKSELSQASKLGVTCNPHRVFVNPISTEGAYYAHQITTCLPNFQTLKVIPIPNHLSIFVLTLISGLRWPLPVDDCMIWDEEENTIRCFNEDGISCYYVMDYCIG